MNVACHVWGSVAGCCGDGFVAYCTLLFVDGLHIPPEEIIKVLGDRHEQKLKISGGFIVSNDDGRLWWVG